MTELTNKEFVKKYVPFSDLKKAGFFEKSLKFNDYDQITERFLTFFGQTKQQYILSSPTIYPTVIIKPFVTGKFPDSIDSNGELKRGDGFHLTQ